MEVTSIIAFVIALGAWSLHDRPHVAAALVAARLQSFSGRSRRLLHPPAAQERGISHVE